MKTRWRVFFGLIIFAVLAWLLRKIDFAEVWHLIQEANNFYFLAAFVTYAVSFLLYSFRADYFVGEIAKVSYFFNLKTTLAGFFVNMITPGAQLGGDPVRAYFLGQKYKKSRTKFFGAILAERFFHFTISMFFIIASILFILTYIPVSLELKTIFQAILFFILVLLLVLIYVSFRKTNFNIELFLKKIKWIFPRKIGAKNQKTELEKILIKHFGHFSRTFKRIVNDKELIIIGISLSVAYWLLNFLASYFLFLSFGVRLSFLLVIVVTSLGNLIGDFSPSPGGIGLVEGFTILAYSALGLNLSVAVAVSLLGRIIFYFFSILLGGISLVHLEHSVK